MKKISFRSLAFKLMVGGCLLTLIPLVIIGWISIAKSGNALLHIGHENLKEQAHEMAALVETNLELQIEMAALVATGEHIVKPLKKVKEHGVSESSKDIAALRVDMKKAFKALDDHFLGVFVTDAQGFALTGELEDGKEYKGFSVKDTDYFLKAKKTGHAVAGDMARSKKTGQLIYVVCSPVVSESGEFLGIFGVSVKAHFLVDIVSGRKHGETGYGWMVNRHGVMISHPNEDHILNMDVKTLPGMEEIIKHMLAKGHGVEDYAFNGMHKIAGYAHIPSHDWSLAITQDRDEFLEAVKLIRNMIYIVGGILTVVTILCVLLFARSITLPINKISDGLRQGAEQVASASGQVSSSSQSMAEGTSQQAAAIEETSSSMEEMSSMTKKNSENAGHADGLMKETNRVVKEANASMNNLTESMEDISKASEETSKIIKTIDEIAFQTNLLALNAAVEAARAGESGAGFAVVADEVRNLAMRAADAARNTSQLIEGTVKKVDTGSVLVKETNDAFGKVAESAVKIAELITEISEASNEQTKGINQVTNAIAEMDKVVQQNAANAEESAASSEQLNAQAEQLREYVGDLTVLISGKKEKKTPEYVHDQSLLPGKRH